MAENTPPVVVRFPGARADPERVARALLFVVLANLRPKRRRKAVIVLQAKASRMAVAARTPFDPERWTLADADAANAVVMALSKLAAPETLTPSHIGYSPETSK